MFRSIIFLVLLTIQFQSFVVAQQVNQLDQNGKRHGAWQKKYEGTNQLRYEGTFDHGKEIGSFKFYDKAGGHPTAIKKYSASIELLDVTFYTTEGKKVSEGKMKGRTREGKWVTYHQDGKTNMIEENYINGKLEGKRVVYFASTKIAQEENYKNDKKEGEALDYTEEGKVFKRLMYKNDVLEGHSQMYNGFGIIEAEGSYKNNRKHGMWKYYKEGKLDKEIKFPQNKIGVN